jgi:hypothetical protein
VIRGRTDTLFNPLGQLSRGQFAGLINRLQAFVETGNADGESSFDGVAGADDFFTDDAGSVFKGDLDALAAFGVLRGDGGTLSRQSEPLSRQAASLIIARVAAVNFNDASIRAFGSGSVLGDVISVSAGPDHSCAVRTGGSVACWAPGSPGSSVTAPARLG